MVEKQKKGIKPNDIPKTITIKQKKVIFIADIHIGVRSSSEEWQENIKNYFYEWFIPYLKKITSDNNDYFLAVLGDVYDDRKSIDINVNNLAIDIFEDLGEILPVYVINGNHDLSKKTNKGNTSLRSLSNIPGITIIKEPTLLKIKPENKVISNIIAIPYLGDHEEENNVLLKFSGKTDYAFMHTDISQFSFDNGMTIVGAVDSDVYKGRIFSGHIHKRQEMKNVIYVGSPYHLRRSDMDNVKGVYTLDFTKKDHNISFKENHFSPIFHKIKIVDFLNMGIEERSAFLNNNYNDIIVDEKELRKYKMSNVYDLANLTTAKRVMIVVNKTKHDMSVDEERDYKELSIEELINDSIDQLDVDNDTKERLKNISSVYLKSAEAEQLEN